MHKLNKKGKLTSRARCHGNLHSKSLILQIRNCIVRYMRQTSLERVWVCGAGNKNCSVQTLKTIRLTRIDNCTENRSDYLWHNRTTWLRLPRVYFATTVLIITDNTDTEDIVEEKKEGGAEWPLLQAVLHATKFLETKLNDATHPTARLCCHFQAVRVFTTGSWTSVYDTGLFKDENPIFWGGPRTFHTPSSAVLCVTAVG
jgi:hypothetical protein